MARRLVSGAKEAMAGLRIAPTEYEKIGSDAAIRSQKERAGHDARLTAKKGGGLGLSVGVRHREPPSGREDTDENDRVFAGPRQVDDGRDVRVACLACGEAAGGHVDNAVRGQAADRGLECADWVDPTDGGNHDAVHSGVDHALLSDGARASG